MNTHTQVVNRDTTFEVYGLRVKSQPLGDGNLLRTSAHPLSAAPRSRVIVGDATTAVVDMILR